MTSTRTGSIILEHDGGGDRSQTVTALRTVIPRLLEEGYRFTVP
jgi:peptidoglycan/xylan/chitin deacetylase (PgdA/CDA1 family)